MEPLFWPFYSDYVANYLTWEGNTENEGIGLPAIPTDAMCFRSYPNLVR